MAKRRVYREYMWAEGEIDPCHKEGRFSHKTLREGGTERVRWFQGEGRSRREPKDGLSVTDGNVSHVIVTQ